MLNWKNILFHASGIGLLIFVFFLLLSSNLYAIIPVVIDEMEFM